LAAATKDWLLHLGGALLLRGLVLLPEVSAHHAASTILTAASLATTIK